MFNIALYVSSVPVHLRRIALFKNNEISKTFLRSFSNCPEPLNYKNEKVIKVAIIGIPNSGKSTLINYLVNRKVCPVSSKVHTTRDNAQAICVEDNTQIVFLDTPGVVTEKEQKRYDIDQKMAVAPKTSLKHADIVGVIHDIAQPWTRESLHPLIINILKKNDNIPSFLILNKIDLLKSKRKLLEFVRIMTKGIIAGKPVVTGKKPKESKVERGFDGFSDVFMISALEGDGVDKIKGYLINCAKPGKWLYTSSEWTDQKTEKLIVDAVRAKFLDFLQQEIPYNLITEMEFLEEKQDGKLVCITSVTCPTERVEKLIAGSGGGRLRQITDAAKDDLVQMFHRPVSLTISLRTDTKIVN